MNTRFQNRQRLTPAVLSTTFAILTCITSPVISQEQDRAKKSQKKDREIQEATEQAPRVRRTTKATLERADDETPALGVLTGSCPGKAVCVKGVLPDGPASEAGIELGDYILSLDGNEVTSPAALKKLLEKMNPDDEVTLRIWRQGEEIDRKVQLASRADQLPKGHDAWLGVMLASNEKGEVRIDHIVPGSPASESELKEGDILVTIDDEEIKDAQSFVEMIEEMGPGDELQLTIRRDNDSENHQIGVELGSFSEAPMAFLRQLQPDFEIPFPRGQRGVSSSDHLIDRALDDMRRQIRSLRDEVRKLKGEKEAEPANPADAKQNDVSDLPGSSGVKLVAQYNYQRRAYNPRYNTYRNYYNSPYSQRYSPYYGHNYGVPYGGNNYYYRYGGRPYYYGGNSSWYGNRPRAGIQFGPNAGVYWY